MQTMAEPTYTIFLKAYDEASKRKEAKLKERGHNDVKPAFSKGNREFTGDNLNDPLMDVLRGELYETVLHSPEDAPIDAHLIQQENLQTMMLLTETKSLVVTWHKNRQQAEAFYRINLPNRSIRLQHVYSFFKDAGYDITEKLNELYR